MARCIDTVVRARDRAAAGERRRPAVAPTAVPVAFRRAALWSPQERAVARPPGTPAPTAAPPRHLLPSSMSASRIRWSCPWGSASTAPSRGRVAPRENCHVGCAYRRRPTCGPITCSARRRLSTADGARSSRSASATSTGVGAPLPPQAPLRPDANRAAASRPADHPPAPSPRPRAAPRPQAGGQHWTKCRRYRRAIRRRSPASRAKRRRDRRA